MNRQEGRHKGEMGSGPMYLEYNYTNELLKGEMRFQRWVNARE